MLPSNPVLLTRPPIVAAAPAAYTANGVNFDGTNDSLARGAGLTGAADSKVGIISFWFKLLGGDGAFQMFLEGTFSRKPSILRLTSNKIAVWLENAAGTQILDMTSTTTYVNGMGWAHFLAAWDLATSTAQMYVNDVNVREVSPPILTNDTIDYTQGNWNISKREGSTLRVNGDIADFYFNIAQTLDISNSANRRKFISAGGAPVSLGADGSLPTGSAPAIYLGNPFGTFETNLGSGGNFTVTGALTAAATNPP